MTTYITKSGDVLDEVVAKFYGHDAGMTEKVLEANPMLAEKGAVLPSGVVIELPIESTRAEKELVRLWD